jgi:large subunit ribosomal protein L10
MADKAETVAALHAKFGVATGAVVSDYRGLNVQEMSALRRRLREVGVELHVVKNTLARRAASATDFEHIVDSFVGPTSIAFTEGDVVAMAKVMTEYAKREPKLEIRAGLAEGQALTAEQVAVLADLPPREVLLAQVLGVLQSPMSGLVGILQGVVRQLVYVLAAIQREKENQSS